MPTSKEAIAEVLKSFDHTTDDIWTDDGAPLVSEVARLTNDKAITRAQINEALPGFARKTSETIDENTQAPVAKNVTITLPPQELEDQGANDPTSQLSTDDIRAILTRRVRDAEQGLVDARNAAASARQAETAAEQRLSRAILNHQRRFPPISVAENIKAHLAAQGRLAMERAGLAEDGRSQIDISMDISRRRGFKRPSRPINNAA